MSKRPTRKDCSDSLTKTKDKGVGTSRAAAATSTVIIGNTISAFLYTKRLLGNGVTAPIYIVNEGVDRVNIDDVRNLGFSAENTKSILHYLGTEQIHYVQYGDEDNVDDADINLFEEVIVKYHVPISSLGDFISAYYIPRIGSWMDHSTSSRVEKFVNEYTQYSPFNAVEKQVANSLSAAWKIPIAKSLIVKKPNIMEGNYVFTEYLHNKTQRQLFLDDYHDVNHAATVSHATELIGLQLAEGSNKNIFNVSAIHGLTGTITDAKLSWKTNQFTYLRLATEAKLDTTTLTFNTFYRAVIPIPLTNSAGVDLTTVKAGPDMLSTYVSFSLYDLNGQAHSSLTWLACCYTTREDLSVVDTVGKYSDDGYTFLIVEAVNTKNRRQGSYSVGERETVLRYNSRLTEKKWLDQFSQVVGTIYNAYTGLTISLADLTNQTSICTVNGTCEDKNSITSIGLRESPLVTVLESVAHLYGSEIYQTVDK